MERRDKINYYLDIAETVLERSTCLRRHYGSVLVKNDIIISTGYNGSPRGIQNCSECEICRREGVPRGTNYNLCPGVHSEMNAIINCNRSEMLGSTLYLVGKEINDNYVKDANPCALCKRLIINSGIEKVVIRIDKDNYLVISVDNWNLEDITGAY